MGEKLDQKTVTDTRERGRTVPQYQSTPEDEDAVETSSEDSFPASDPPSYTPVSHTGKPKPEERGDKDR
ncbi:MAG: hypothetical protein ACM33T_03295 [Solirubrobacterales bacterium]